MYHDTYRNANNNLESMNSTIDLQADSTDSLLLEPTTSHEKTTWLYFHDFWHLMTKGQVLSKSERFECFMVY